MEIEMVKSLMLKLFSAICANFYDYNSLKICVKGCICMRETIKEYFFVIDSKAIFYCLLQVILKSQSWQFSMLGVLVKGVSLSKILLKSAFSSFSNIFRVSSSMSFFCLLTMIVGVNSPFPILLNEKIPGKIGALLCFDCRNKYAYMSN